MKPTTQFDEMLETLFGTLIIYIKLTKLGPEIPGLPGTAPLYPAGNRVLKRVQNVSLGEARNIITEFTRDNPALGVLPCAVWNFNKKVRL